MAWFVDSGRTENHRRVIDVLIADDTGLPALGGCFHPFSRADCGCRMGRFTGGSHSPSILDMRRDSSLWDGCHTGFFSRWPFHYDG